MRGRNCFAIVVAGMAISLSAVAKAEERPWSERVITSHVDMAEFAGRLEKDQLERLVAAGERLFTGKFTKADGAGRPMATQAIIPTKRRRPARSAFQRLSGPDANACSSCHIDPIVGGAGDLAVNVFVSEGFTNADFDTSDPQFSNERNTNHLMGAGLVELLAREMTRDLAKQRNAALKQARLSGMAQTVDLKTKGVGFGKLTAHPDGIVDLSAVEGVDDDLHVRPFSQKGVFISLRQFTVNAMNHHHGMQADERFGDRWTGETDFDEDGKVSELTDGDIAALVAWQATLPVPTRLEPEHKEWVAMAAKGERLFDEIGCESCHRKSLPLESVIFSDPAPYDVAGTLRVSDADKVVEYDLAQFDWVKALPRNEDGHVLVPLFSDLKRHRISDVRVAVFGNELLSQRFVERDQFQTTELWGVASTAPYGHRGNLTTLDEAIRGHGGEASEAAKRYTNLSEEERDAVIAFLKTLVIEDE